MRIKEILAETAGLQTFLNPNDLTKHGPGRLENLIKMISDGTPLYTADGTPVTIHKSEADRISNLYKNNQFRGRIDLLDADGIKRHPLNAFLKTKEFGGQSVPPGQENDDNVPVSSIKPGQVMAHGDLEKGQSLTPEVAVNLGAFRASLLGQKIIENKYLDSQGRVGQAVKQIAREIESGSLPTIPQLTTGELNNIQNYGFEYLGVQELIKGVADFPNSDLFYQHVGVDINSLMLYFPKSSGNPLADSYALVNKETENTIGMSSKGAKGGAPSSINGLKLSPAMMKMVGKDPSITLINLLQSTTPWKQPFVAVNWLHENFPGKLGVLEKFLPFDDQFLNWCEGTWDNRNSGVPETLEEIPSNYKPLYKLVMNSVAKTVKNPIFYDVRYYVKDMLHRAIRSGVVPNFNKRMLELLGENFIVLKTEKVGKPGVGKFVTKVQWPSKVGGTVTFEHKDPAPKWTSAITWKLS